MKRLLVVAIFLQILLFFQLQAVAQITPTFSPSVEDYKTKADLDLGSINDWMEQSKTESVEKSAESFSVMLLTMQANYFWLYYCNPSAARSELKYYNLNLTSSAQKSLLKSIRQQMEFIEKNFTFWPTNMATDRRRASIARALQCVERIPVLEQDKSISYWEACASDYTRFQPTMSKETAYKSVIALTTIQRAMNIYSCSNVQGDFVIRDAEMEQDYVKVKHLMNAYFFDHIFKVKTTPELSEWLGRFHKP